MDIVYRKKKGRGRPRKPKAGTFTKLTKTVKKDHRLIKDLMVGGKNYQFVNSVTLVPQTIIGTASNISVTGWTFNGLYPFQTDGATVGINCRKATQIQPMRIRYKVHIQRHQTSNDFTNVAGGINVRIMVIKYVHPAGTPGIAGGSLMPTFEDTFCINPLGAMVEGTLLAYKTREDPANTVVYYDKTVFVPNANLTITGAGLPVVNQSLSKDIFLHIDIDCKKHKPVTYNQTAQGGALVSCSQNAYGIYFFTDNIVANTYAPNMWVNMQADYLG